MGNCESCLKCCIFCGPLLAPLGALSCLPCFLYCSCLNPWNGCRLCGTKPFRISEYVLKSGYENVRAAFEANFHRGLERGAQLVVWENGEKKVDLAGITLPESKVQRPYDGDSLHIVWSSGKNIEAIAMCILVDRGLLKYEAKVSEYWPEFGQFGKEDIRVETVLRHDSGLHGLSRILKHDETLESIGKVIEESALLCNSRVYHAYTRGLILNQICIRVDPHRRTMGQLLKEEVFEKIGLKDSVFFGKNSEDLAKRVYPLTERSALYDISQVYCPTCMRHDMPWTNTSKGERDSLLYVAKNSKHIRDSLVFNEKLYINMKAEQGYAVDPNNDLECSSAWMVGNARVLAKCAALLSQGGTLNGVQIVKRSTVEQALSSPQIAKDISFGCNTVFTKGGYNIVGLYDKLEDLPERKTYGWGGFNGSLFYFDYPGGKAFGYNCTANHRPVPWDIKGAEIVRQLGYEKFLHPEGPANYRVAGTPTDTVSIPAGGSENNSSSVRS